MEDTEANSLHINCRVGTLLLSSCDNVFYVKKNALFKISEHMSQDEKELLQWRTGYIYYQEDTICSHHYYFYIKCFEKNQTSCCDPFNQHAKPITIKKDLRVISLKKAKIIKESNGLSLIPGHLLCSNCRKQLAQPLQEEANKCNSINIAESEEEDDDLKMASRLSEKDKLNETLIDLGLTPLKLKSVGSHSKPKYAKRKFNEAKTKFKTKLEYVMDIEDSSSDSEKVGISDIPKSSEDLEELVRLMKEKLRAGNLSNRDKIQILTIAPKSWSRARVAETFNVSEYMVRKARNLLSEKGIFAIPEPNLGRKINPETIVTVQNFYQDDEYSKMMPGAKDKVSVKRNEYQQKRLILCNLDELYCEFKQKHPGIKIGMSKFCSLRPKWCVLAGAPGTHAVCVCTIHGNAELLATAMGLHHKEALHDMISQLVCEKGRRECMLRRCEKCPDNTALTNFLKEVFKDYENEDEVKFSQWANDERIMKLQSMVLPLQEFIDLAIKKVEGLIPHSFIAKTQSAYLKERKVNLRLEEVMVLMDFAENYSFVLQNEVQSYHWSHLSCTLHPVVIYSKNDDNTLRETSICFLSDDLKHDVPFVYCIQRKTAEFIKTQFPDVKRIEYVTDGCSAQYKNFKTMINLCTHFEDFGLDACWSFHATSHGKTVCDGIGGSVKRTVTKRNLQSIRRDQIVNVQQMFTFCTNQFSKITFFFLAEQEINSARTELEPRFAKGRTITGTRSFHFFQPITSGEIVAKRTSKDPKICLRYRVMEEVTVSLSEHPRLGYYVCCIYEQIWWVGIVEEVNKEEGDFDILFMHPHGPSKTFFWPDKEDKCPVCPDLILCTIDPPEATTTQGRVYRFDSSSQRKISEKWDFINTGELISNI